MEPKLIITQLNNFKTVKYYWRMSLLEDVFLQDEADEAQVLERIIDGDDLENVPCYEEDDDDDSPKEDEAGKYSNLKFSE